MLCSCWGGCFGKGSETADPVTSTTRTLLSCASPHSKRRAEPCTGLCPPARGSQGVCTQARARCTRGGAQSSPTPGLTFKPLIRDPKTALITASCLAEGLSQEGTSGFLTPDPNPVSDQAAQVFAQLGLERSHDLPGTLFPHFPAFMCISFLIFHQNLPYFRL